MVPSSADPEVIRSSETLSSEKIEPESPWRVLNKLNFPFSDAFHSSIAPSKHPEASRLSETFIRDVTLRFAFESID